jgi:hypothetical protein
MAKARLRKLCAKLVPSKARDDIVAWCGVMVRAARVARVGGRLTCPEGRAHIVTHEATARACVHVFVCVVSMCT